MKVSFNGNFLIKFPSEKARSASELFIRCDDNDEFIYCDKIGKDKLHIMTGKEAKDWEDMVEVCKKCNFTKLLYELYDVVNKHFLQKAEQLDFSEIKQDDKFINGCLKYLVKEKSDYKWLPEKAEEIIKK